MAHIDITPPSLQDAVVRMRKSYNSKQHAIVHYDLLQRTATVTLEKRRPGRGEEPQYTVHNVRYVIDGVYYHTLPAVGRAFPGVTLAKLLRRFTGKRQSWPTWIAAGEELALPFSAIVD